MWKPAEVYQKPEPAPKNTEARKEQINFENGERPKYKYYYHGTFAASWQSIKETGKFHFDEYKPNLTLSPDYGFDFAKTEAGKSPEQSRTRGRYLPEEKKKNFKLDERDSVLLVIEPTADYNIHTTTEGMPNVFPTPDEVPADANKTVRTRIWTSNQKILYKELLSKKNEEYIRTRSKSGIRHPGMSLDKKLVLNNDGMPTGEWAKLEQEKRIKQPGEMDESVVKMAIKKEPVFIQIFEDMKEEIKQGKKVDLSVYKQRLIEYFKKAGDNIERRQTVDEAELAENMVVGEFEHYLVCAMRRLYLDIQRFKGKKVIPPDPEKEKAPAKIKTKDKIMEIIERLRSLKPDNQVFQRYIEINTAALEKEFN